MQKRIFTLVLVVVVGVLAGVGIVSKQAREPLLRELLKQQNVMLQKQSNIESNFGVDIKTGETGSGQVNALLIKQKNMEKRLAALEVKINSLQGIVQQAKGNGENVRQAPPAEDPSKVYDIAVAHSPVKGKKNAPVTIVEFVDFQCPFCARFHPPINEVLKAYPNKVNYMVKNFPLSFHPEAKPAAKAAFAAGEQGKYWEMADALLENGRNLSEEKYKELAGTLGLDVKKFMDDYKKKDAKWEDYIGKDMALAGQVNVRGTPTFYINGKKTNARDFNAFKNEVDQILKGQK